MDCGYRYLVGKFGLKAFRPEIGAQSDSRCNRRLETSSGILVPPTAAPKSGAPLDHILFALKNEGINLQVLSQALPLVPPGELSEAVRRTPSGVYLRKAAFLWEAFTERTLEDVAPSGRPTPLFDDSKYVTGPAIRNKKWRIDFNGLGTLRYCATVRRTPEIEAALKAGTLKRAEAWLSSIGKEHAGRAMPWAELVEFQKSFELEREPCDLNRAAQLAKVLHRAIASPLSESSLCELQNAMVSTPCFAAASFRTEQNWLGKVIGRGVNTVTYVPPTPEALSGMMEDWMAAADRLAGATDPIAAAAVTSFGFVYLHPFMDGNGRLSRFLIHRQLMRSRALAEGVLLPISVAMKKNEAAYLAALSAYSQKMRPFWNVSWTGGTPEFAFDFLGEDTLYRYWDATEPAVFLHRMAQEALDVHLKEEVEYLALYDKLERRLGESYDLPSQWLARFVNVLMESGGRFSKSFRQKMADKIDAEALDGMEQIAQDMLAEDLSRRGE